MASRRAARARAVEVLSAGGTQPFTWRTAEAAGLTRKGRAALRSSGGLFTPLHGVLARDDTDDVAARARAGALILPPGGAIGRRTAAELLGIDPRTPWERDEVLDVECLVPRGRTPLRRPGVRSFVTDLDPLDIDDRRGFPVTTPDRTAADLLRWLPPFMAQAVLDRMARLDMISAGGIRAILDRWEGHRNIATARHLLDHVEPKAQSYGESWLRWRIIAAGFPVPQAQIPIRDAAGRVIYWLDLGWPELRIAAEYDGEEFHDGLDAERHDDERRSDLRKNHRWNVIGFRKGLVLGPVPTLEFALGELLGMTPLLRHLPI